MKTVEYRVRPVVRYIVTRYTQEDSDSTSAAALETLGEFDNESYAEQVAEAMRKEPVSNSAEGSNRSEAARWEAHIRMGNDARQFGNDVYQTGNHAGALASHF